MFRVRNKVGDVANSKNSVLETIERLKEQECEWRIDEIRLGGWVDKIEKTSSRGKNKTNFLAKPILAKPITEQNIVVFGKNPIEKILKDFYEEQEKKKREEEGKQEEEIKQKKEQSQCCLIL